MEGLHKALARVLVNTRKSLSGAEIRFVRKELGLSQKALGDLLGVSDQCVALYEKRGRMPKAPDTLLRLIFTEQDKGTAPVVEFIRRLNEQNLAEEGEIVATEQDSGWGTQMAA